MAAIVISLTVMAMATTVMVLSVVVAVTGTVMMTRAEMEGMVTTKARTLPMTVLSVFTN